VTRPILVGDRLERTFGGKRTLLGRTRPAVHAVQGVCLELNKGETLGIVGESGSGKSTLARLLVGLDRPTGGTIMLKGADIAQGAGSDRHGLARIVQYVFQDPLSALNPRKTIRSILEAPMIHLLRLDSSSRKQRLERLMAAVNLHSEFLDRYPHEFSGGQAQRIGIARALAADPEIIVLDEPVSALDVSIQAQVLKLLGRLKNEFNLTYVFISHDLSVVESMSDRVAVMYFGRIVELASAHAIFNAPRHPYTKLLLDSAPRPGKKHVEGNEDVAELPDPFNPPPGCAFAPRCPGARSDCRQSTPDLVGAAQSSAHCAACLYPLKSPRIRTELISGSLDET
jgi:oligopeptide/dipeptide ABC transporter ATP-binding protein